MINTSQIMLSFFIFACHWIIVITTKPQLRPIYLRGHNRNKNAEVIHYPTVNIPLIPDGEKEFKFYTLTAYGTLESRWLSLQTIQDIIIRNGLSKELIQNTSNFTTKQNTDHLQNLNVPQINFQNDLRRNESNIDDVIANVQKVMSEKFTVSSSSLPVNQKVLNSVLPGDVKNSVIMPFSIDSVMHGTNTAGTDNDKQLETTLYTESKIIGDTNENKFNVQQMVVSAVEHLQSQQNYFDNKSNFIETTTSFYFDVPGLEDPTNKVPITTTTPFKTIQDENEVDLYVNTKPDNNSLDSNNSRKASAPNIDDTTSSWIFISSSNSIREVDLSVSTNTTEADNWQDKPGNITKKESNNILSKLGKVGHIVLPSNNKNPQTIDTNVLTASEISDVSMPQLHVLGDLGSKQSNTVDYYDDTLYLEDLPEVNYDYPDKYLKKENAETLDLNFPGPNVAISYFQPDHIQNKSSVFHSPIKLPIKNAVNSTSQTSHIDPTQFLPQYNPEIAKGSNPLNPTPPGNIGLEESIQSQNKDATNFIERMNSISFEVYKRTATIHRRQNMIMSTLNLISVLSMLRLGARNTTADILSMVLKLEEFMSFNSHQMMRNITSSSLNLNNFDQEIAFVNNIFIEKPEKPHSLDFIGRVLNYFYNARAEQVPLKAMGAAARDRSNEEIRKQTKQKVYNFLKPEAQLVVNGPMAVVSSGYFQGKWPVIVDGSDIVDMNFIRFPSAERRLIKTVGISKKMKINAGYSPEMDATVAEIPLLSEMNEFSLILVMPGRQKNFIANGLSQLEQSLNVQTWSKLLRSVIPHNLVFKMPIFSHRNYLNLSQTLSEIGLGGIFRDDADFSGFNGQTDLFVGDVIQLNEFHSIKLKSPIRSSKSLYTVYTRKKNSQTNGQLKLPEELLIPTTSKYTPHVDIPILAYDRAFFYSIRHNPSGLLLFIGRYLDPESF